MWFKHGLHVTLKSSYIITTWGKPEQVPHRWVDCGIFLIVYSYVVNRFINQLASFDTDDAASERFIEQTVYKQAEQLTSRLNEWAVQAD